jgi:putative addiction module killer protein
MVTSSLQITEYVRANGSCPYAAWFDQLDAQAAAKVATAVLRLSLGNVSNVKWFAGLGELRIHWGAGYRIYFVQDGDSVVILLGGGTKRTQRRDIGRAQELRTEIRRRKDAFAQY